MKIEDITVVDFVDLNDCGSSYLGLQTYLKRYKKVEPLKLGDKAYIGSELVKLNEPPGWVAKFFVWQGKKERSTQKAMVLEFLHHLGMLTALEDLVQVGVLEMKIMSEGRELPGRNKTNPYIDKSVAWITLINDTWNNWTAKDGEEVSERLAAYKKAHKKKKGG